MKVKCGRKVINSGGFSLGLARFFHLDLNMFELLHTSFEAYVMRVIKIVHKLLLVR